jgi:hypothetical protein
VSEPFLKMQQLLDALSAEGIKSSKRTIDRECEAGMEYWLFGGERHFKLDTARAHLMKRWRRQRCPEPRRRGRPPKAA